MLPTQQYTPADDAPPKQSASQIPWWVGILLATFVIGVEILAISQIPSPAANLAAVWWGFVLAMAGCFIMFVLLLLYRKTPGKGNMTYWCGAAVAVFGVALILFGLISGDEVSTNPNGSSKPPVIFIFPTTVQAPPAETRSPLTPDRTPTRETAQLPPSSAPQAPTGPSDGDPTSPGGAVPSSDSPAPSTGSSEPEPTEPTTTAEPVPPSTDLPREGENPDPSTE